MHAFLTAHATHPDWRAALALAMAQLDAQQPRQGGVAVEPTLGFVYLTDHYAADARELHAALKAHWPAVAWAGTVGVGVAASGVEYFDEPALVLMLTHVPVGRFQVFSGARPLSGITAYTALVHADPHTPDLAELIGEMSDRTESGYLFGGLASSRGSVVQVADGVYEGGLSGVAFTRDVSLVSRVTQGCQPDGPVRRVTAAQRNVVLELDGKPALDCLLQDLGVDLEKPRMAVPRLRSTLVGLSDSRDTVLSRPGQFGTDTRVRHLIGIDPGERAIALADIVEPDMQLTFCSRNVEAARRDLVRICAEIREELSPETEDETALARTPGGTPGRADASTPPPVPHPGSRIAGALYVSCAGRGGPHFGGPSAELQILRHALGDVPLAGFFAGGEIGHRHLYGYTGVLTVFTTAG
jgi:small ligand-binding sensory domain FIST